MSIPTMRVAPSLLACDFARLEEEVKGVQQAGADWLHLDVMDGHFVPNLTIGPVVVGAINKSAKVPLDVHLMIEDPAKHVPSFIKAGASHLTVHVEAKELSSGSAMNDVIKLIRDNNCRPGISIRPKTPVEALKPWIKDIDLVLIMSVEPGFGGQSFITGALDKISELRKEFSGDIAVDGGITDKTGKQCLDAGANVLVAGTYIFGSSSYKDTIASLRGN